DGGLETAIHPVGDALRLEAQLFAAKLRRTDQLGQPGLHAAVSLPELEVGRLSLRLLVVTEVNGDVRGVLCNQQVPHRAGEAAQVAPVSANGLGNVLGRRADEDAAKLLLFELRPQPFDTS